MKMLRAACKCVADESVDTNSNHISYIYIHISSFFYIGKNEMTKIRDIFYIFKKSLYSLLNCLVLRLGVSISVE